MTKTWILYEGARIELALFNYYRGLYNPMHDEYIHFWIDDVDAD